jgi:DNA-binding NarL/FixJ family response regulator
MGATRALRVMLVEDHATFRQALARLLAHELDLKMVAQALEGGLKGRLDVAMLDLGLPDRPCPTGTEGS